MILIIASRNNDISSCSPGPAWHHLVREYYDISPLAMNGSRSIVLLRHHGVTGENFILNEFEAEDFLASGERPRYNVLDTGKFRALTGLGARARKAAREDFITKDRESIILM
jgi:hypothetical protein